MDALGFNLREEVLLSAAHGLHDLEHYLVRFVVAFTVAAIALLVLAAVVAGLANL